MADETTMAPQSAQAGTEAAETPQENAPPTGAETAPEAAQQETPTLETMIQKAVDRATNKLGNDNKKLRGELEALRREKLTVEERRQLELADKEADIADREARLQEKENRLFAIKAIKEAGLDDGSSNALELVDFVLCGSEAATIARVNAFNALVKKFVAAEVSRTFQANGRNPETGTGGAPAGQTELAASIGRAKAARDAAASKVIDQYLGRK